MAEQRVDGRQPASKHGVIDGVVVHERGEMHQLDDSGQCDSARLRPPVDGARQERERRTEHLATHLQQMPAHFANQRQVVGGDVVHLADNVLEALLDRGLYVAQRPSDRGPHSREGAAHRAARSSSLIRSAMSRNSMSRTNTR